MLKEKSETVKVVVRCRPLSPKEMSEQRECVVSTDMIAHTITAVNPANQRELKNFTFDYTYDWNASQEKIFNETAKPILESVMEGYNGTIFAYGQTGTGKTYTMEGTKDETGKGIIPRAIDWIYSNIKTYANQQFLVRCSFVEIYNEEVRDLLGKNPKARLTLREKNKVFYLEDVTVYQAEHPKVMLSYMKDGAINRATGATKMNPGSSRSHSIFSIIVEASSTDEQGETHYRVGKLNLVDLAGSERQSKTESTGERFKEATKINLSLTILGSVINKLVSGKSQYIPYRDSKLTMLLQDSLGGNTKTVMIANVGPADYNYDETINTLWYANNAKKIKNKPRINEDPKDALLRQYQEEIELMKKKLLALGKGDLLNKISGGKGGGFVTNEENLLKDALSNFEKEKEEFMRKKDEEIKEVKKKKDMAENEKKALIENLNKEREDFEKKKVETEQLYKEFEKKQKAVLKGEQTSKKVKQQEKEIFERQEEIEIKKREEQRLQESLKSKATKNLELKKQYTDQKTQLDDLNLKLGEIQKNFEELQNDISSRKNQLDNDVQEWNEQIRYLDAENKQYDFILKKYVPEEEYKRILGYIDYQSEDKTFSINRKKAIRNNYKDNMNKLSQMRKKKLGFGINKNISNDDLPIELGLTEQQPVTKTTFSESGMESFVDEINHIIKDDDSDLSYYDKALKISTPTLNAAIVGVNPRKAL